MNYKLGFILLFSLLFYFLSFLYFILILLFFILNLDKRCDVMSYKLQSQNHVT